MNMLLYSAAWICSVWMNVLITVPRNKPMCNYILIFLLPETENSCKVCCRGKDGKCSPFMQSNGSFLFLRKGKPCTVGFCDGSVSHKNIYIFPVHIHNSIWLSLFCSVISLLFLALKSFQMTLLYFFGKTGKVYEAGTRCDREVVGFYWQAGHKHIW